MKLSVILPCFNAAKTIDIQLEALANQQWIEPWEVIVSNNGSTDNSMEIVEQYRNRLPNLQIVNAHNPSEPRRGVAHSYNIGVQAATGDAFVFCESDDEVALGWLAAMGEALKQYDFVAGALEYRKFNEAWQLGSGEHNQETKLIQHSFPPYLPYASGCNLGMKRSVYEAVGEFDESVRGSWDTDYCWRVQLAGTQLYYIPTAVIHYRYRNEYKDIYRQGKTWGESFILLRQKYETDTVWGKHPVQRQILTTISHLFKVIGTINNKGEYASWLWGLGWQVGTLTGLVKRKSVPYFTQAANNQLASAGVSR